MVDFQNNRILNFIFQQMFWFFLLELHLMHLRKGIEY
jgi:hypothetical protein